MVYDCPMTENQSAIEKIAMINCREKRLKFLLDRPLTASLGVPSGLPGDLGKSDLDIHSFISRSDNSIRSNTGKTFAPSLRCRNVKRIRSRLKSRVATRARFQTPGLLVRSEVPATPTAPAPARSRSLRCNEVHGNRERRIPRPWETVQLWHRRLQIFSSNSSDLPVCRWSHPILTKNFQPGQFIPGEKESIAIRRFTSPPGRFRLSDHSPQPDPCDDRRPAADHRT